MSGVAPPWKRQAEKLKPQQTKGSPRQAGKSTAGFRSFSGLPVPTWFLFSDPCFVCRFFVQGGVPAPQEPMEKLSSTGRSALDPFKHGCFYTGQPPDVPMALFFFEWLQAPLARYCKSLLMLPVTRCNQIIFYSLCTCVLLQNAVRMTRVTQQWQTR